MNRDEILIALRTVKCALDSRVVIVREIIRSDRTVVATYRRTVALPTKKRR